MNETINTEVEVISSKRNIRKKSEKSNENFVFKKPETPSKSTSPVSIENNRYFFKTFVEITIII